MVDLQIKKKTRQTMVNKNQLASILRARTLLQAKAIGKFIGSTFSFFQSLVSNQNLFSGGAGAGQVTDKVVSLSFTGSKDDGSVDGDGKECTVEGLEEEISVILPRNNTSKNPPEEEGKLHSDKYSIHEFNITENASTVTVQVGWNVSVPVQIYIKKGSRPKPEESVYDFNATFRFGGRYCDDSTNFSLCKLFLSNDDLNWTAAGQYFAMLSFTKNDSLPAEELDEIGSDGTVPYKFSMYTSKCMFYDEEKSVWSTDGLKVRFRKFIECSYF